jgi:predicted naringenin-chalcone synthase
MIRHATGPKISDDETHSLMRMQEAKHQISNLLASYPNLTALEWARVLTETLQWVLRQHQEDTWNNP